MRSSGNPVFHSKKKYTTALIDIKMMRILSIAVFSYHLCIVSFKSCKLTSHGLCLLLLRAYFTSVLFVHIDHYNNSISVELIQLKIE